MSPRNSPVWRSTDKVLALLLGCPPLQPLLGRLFEILRCRLVIGDGGLLLVCGLETGALSSSGLRLRGFSWAFGAPAIPGPVRALEASPEVKVPVWFANDRVPPLLAFAGLWANWTYVRKAKEGEITADIFALLTCEPNVEVGRVHPKAMPVILTTIQEYDAWLRAPWD